MNKLAAAISLALPLAASAACDPSGEYVRDPEALLSIHRVNDEYELMLNSEGQQMPDGTMTSGAVRGKFSLSDVGCAGAYLNPGEDCALFVNIFSDRAEVHQFGDCSFGASAWGGGVYRRDRKQKGSTRPSNLDAPTVQLVDPKRTGVHAGR